MAGHHRQLGEIAIGRHVLEEVLQAESAARGILRTAEEERDEILKKARAEALSLLDEGEKRRRQSRQHKLEEKRKELKKKTASILEKEARETAELEKAVLSRKMKAAALVLSEFRKLIEKGGSR